MNSHNEETWGKDSLTEFIGQANNNNLAVYLNVPELTEVLVRIDRLYVDATKAINHVDSPLSAFLIFRAHASFRGAARLSTSCELPESYALMRCCIENALCGFYVHKHPEHFETWWRRQESGKRKELARNEFSYGKMIHELGSHNDCLAQIVKFFYEQTIDYGAHPNVYSLGQVMDRDGDDYSIHYLRAEETPLQLAIAMTGQVGFCGLSIFEQVFPERFLLVGIADMLRKQNWPAPPQS